MQMAFILAPICCYVARKNFRVDQQANKDGGGDVNRQG